MLNVLILGGYGFFGARIARSLAANGNVRIIVAGRDARKAVAAAQEIGLSESQGVSLDACDEGLGRRFAELGVDVVVHTAGPFQGQDYHVARAAVAAGCDYIDLADDRRFVAGIESLDPEARARGVAIVAGASSVPALSCAVIDRYLPRFARLDTIRVGIGSGARAPGLATVRGIFGYAGKPFLRWRGGQWEETHGWLDLRRHEFPSPVGWRFMASCDVPDLELYPRRYPTIETVTFHAGFASPVGHLAVWTLACLVKAGWLRSAAPMAAPLQRLAQWLEPLVSDRGGMFVELGGEAAGRSVCLTWHLVTARNHGPYVPCGAAIALVGRLSRGVRLPAGATACVGLLSVEEYLAPLRDLDVREVLPA